MLGLLRHTDHLPGGGKDGLITLGLPKLNVEEPVRRFPANHPGLKY